jgi:hypothetical protein
MSLITCTRSSTSSTSSASEVCVDQCTPVNSDEEFNSPTAAVTGLGMRCGFGDLMLLAETPKFTSELSCSPTASDGVLEPGPRTPSSVAAEMGASALWTWEDGFSSAATSLKEDARCSGSCRKDSAIEDWEAELQSIHRR